MFFNHFHDSLLGDLKNYSKATFNLYKKQARKWLFPSKPRAETNLTIHK